MKLHLIPLMLVVVSGALAQQSGKNGNELRTKGVRLKIWPGIERLNTKQARATRAASLLK